MTRDRGDRRRRAAGHPVGRGDRHHDQPRGPGDPARAGRRRRRRASARDLDVIAGLAERLGSPVPFATDAEEIFAELGRASAGGRADYAGITYDRIRAEHGVFWPCPDARRTPARRGCSPTRFATPTAGPGSSPSSTAARPSRPTTSSRSTSRPAGCSRSTSPAPRPAGSATLPDTGPFVELHPMLADRIGAHDGEPGRRPHPARRAEGAGPGRHDDPPGHRLRAVPLGRRQPAHQRRARPVQPDAGVQGLRRGGDAHERAGSAWSSSAPGWPRPGWSRSWSPAARRTGGRSPCSATSRTRRTTGSCCPPCSRAPTGRSASLRARSGTPTTVDLRLGARVVEIDRERARGRCSSTARCIAVRRAGARDRQHPDAAADPRPGPDRRPADERVHAFRSLDDCLRPRRAAVPGRRGARSSSAAACSASRSPGRSASAASATEVVEGGDHLLRSQVDAKAGAILARDLTRLGTTVYTGARAIRLTDGRAWSLDNGFVLDTDLVVLTAGGRPSTALARRAGLEVRRGIVVDDRLRQRSDPRHPRDRRLRRARRPGHRLRAAGVGAGRGARRRPRPASPRRTTAAGPSPGCAPPASTSPSSATRARPRAEVVEMSNPVRGSHRKLVVRDGVVVAATLVGDLSRIGLITQHYDRRHRPRADRARRPADGRPAAAPPRRSPTTPRSAPAPASAPARSGPAPRSPRSARPPAPPPAAAAAPTTVRQLLAERPRPTLEGTSA